MSDYIVTRESMGQGGAEGDRLAMEALIQGNLNTFVEDLIIEPPSSFFYNSNYIHTLHLVNLRALKSSSISNCNLLTVLNLPDLEEINGSAISQLDNLEIIGENGLSEQTLPKLKYIQGSGIYYLSKLQSLYLPELLYVKSGISYLNNLSTLNVPKLEVCDTTFSNLSNLLTLELPSIKIIGTRTFYSPYQENWNSMAAAMFSECPMLQVVDFSSENLYLINLGQAFYIYYSGHDGVSTVNLIIRSKIIPYLQAFQVPMLYSGRESYKTINIRVPFHLLNDYKSSPFWGSTNYLSHLLSLETINEEHNSSVSIAKNEIPYWATSNEITCTLNCDWTDNITGTEHTGEDLTYTVHKRFPPHLGSTAKTVTLSQQYGSQTLSAQCTQTPIDFSVGYSVPDQTTWHYVGEWGTLQNPKSALQPLKENHVFKYSDNYVYFTCDGFHDSNVDFYKKRSDINIYHLLNIPDECDYFKNSICIFFNGYTTFDFYIVQNTNYQGNQIVVLPLDQYYPDPNTVPPLYSDISNPSSYNGPYYITTNVNDTTNYTGYNHYHKSTQEGVPNYNDALASPTESWHRVRFTNLDGGAHFVRVIEYSTSHTQDKALYYLNRPIIAIRSSGQNSYTYVPTA